MRTFLGWSQWTCGGTLLLAVGCVPSVDEDPSLTYDGQVLALQFEPAEAAPKDASSVTALVASNEDGGATNVRFDLCLARKALSDLGPVSPECISPKTGSDSVINLGRGTNVEFDVPEDACRLFGPQRPSAEPGQPPGRPVDPDATGGFYQPVVARAADAVLGGLRLDCGLPGGSQAQVAEYNKQYTANTNPTLTSLEVRVGSGSWTTVSANDTISVTRGNRLSFRSKWSKPETYLLLDSESRSLESTKETYLATFYGSAGGLPEHRKLLDKNHSVTSAWQTAEGVDSATFWIVVRDGRGGVGFAQFEVEVD